MNSSRNTRIKICGITSPKDALLATEAGADYLGLIFAPSSPRAVNLHQAREIVSVIQGRVPLVGVFQNQPLDFVKQTAQALDLGFIQLHGTESVDYCQALSRPLIKMIPVTPEGRWEDLAPFLSLSAQGKLIPLFEPPKGVQKALWHEKEIPAGWMTLLSRLNSQPGLPCFLAGGLTPENIARVLETFQPWGVDAASGIEASPGVKDPEKLRQFCQTIHLTQKGEDASCVP